MSNFYNLPFKASIWSKFKAKFNKTLSPEARAFLPKIYLSLDFLTDLELDVKSFDLKVIYTNTSLGPILTANGQGINKYCQLCGTLSEPLPINATRTDEKFIFIGFKHFDKWKFYNGKQIGDYKSENDSKSSLKLKRMIQREVLGFKAYWSLRLQRKI